MTLHRPRLSDRQPWTNPSLGQASSELLAAIDCARAFCMRLVLFSAQGRLPLGNLQAAAGFAQFETGRIAHATTGRFGRHSGHSEFLDWIVQHARQGTPVQFQGTPHTTYSPFV